MRHLYLIMLPLSLIAASTSTGEPAQAPTVARSVVPFNTNWAFNYFPEPDRPVETTSVEWDDSAWELVSTPHTWSTFETTREVHPFIHSASERMDPYWWKGWGVYRKAFLVGPELDGKEIFAEFEGVQKYAEVYLNGHYIGQHKGGYTGFSFNLGDFLYRDGRTGNVLTVLVSNRRDDLFGGIPPMTAGNFNVYGGIYREVRLVAAGDIHFPFQGSAEHEGGLFWRTPLVSEKRATVTLDAWVRNAREAAAEVRVQAAIHDPQGQVVATAERTAVLPAGEITQVTLPVMNVIQPRLWCPESPHLYRIEATVLENDVLRDTIRAPLGFRWYRWDYDTNTLIWNGRPVTINGTNRHQEYPWIGDALPGWIHRRDMEDIRLNLNHNFMRTAHYPQDPTVYDLADRLGIITVAEVPNIKPLNFGDDIQEANLVEMIRRLRNHPSIFMWSMGNETKDAADSRWAAREDPTRLLHQRKAHNFGDFVDHDHTHLDMESLLRVTVRGWYTDEVKDNEPTNSRETPKSGQVAGTEEWQHLNARIQNGSIRGLVNAQGVAWLYADHGADRIYKDSPLKNVNAKGWVDLYREPKYMYYLWQANWATTPMVHVRPYYWQQAYVGRDLPVQVDSNGDEVELLVNGRSLGRQSLSRENFHTVSFEAVPVQPGQLTGVAYRDGIEVARHTVTMPGPAAAIHLTASHTEAMAGGESLVEVRATVVDADGHRVPEARPVLEWSVNGPGKLVGPARWETDFDKTLADAGCWYIDTPVANLVRTTHESGRISLRVEAAGLQAGELTIEVHPAEVPDLPGLALLPVKREGRLPVTRVEGFQQRLPRLEVLAPMSGNKDFPQEDPEAMEIALRAWLAKRHDSPFPQDRFSDLLVSTLQDNIARSSGVLIGDDFNFQAALYNDIRSIEQFLGILPFHLEYRAQWIRHLGEEVLARGEPVDPDTWERFLHSIPGEGRYIQLDLNLPEGAAVDDIYRNTEFLHRVRGPSLEAVVEHFEPGWGDLSKSERKAALAFLKQINPDLLDRPKVSWKEETLSLWIPALEPWLKAIARE